MKSVAVLLSTYNGEKYIPCLLDSLKEQEGVELHVFVRDDGSKDSSVKLCKEHLGDLATVFAEPNVGSTKSFMWLLNNVPADYDYYAFCDQDDYWEKDKLARAVSFLENQPDVVCKPSLYFSGQKLVDEELKPIDVHVIEQPKDVRTGVIFNQMAGCTAVFNKALLLLAKKSPDASPKFHDSYLYRLCVAFEGNIVVDQESRIQYRQHGNNVVGLAYGLKGTLHLLKQHYEALDAGIECREILHYYLDELPDGTRQLFIDVANANKDKAARKRLRKEHNIDFGNWKKKLVFKAKLRHKKI